MEFNSIYHRAKFEPNWFINVRRHTNVKILTQSVKQQLFPLFVQIQLLQKHITFHNDQIKTMQENEAKKFLFALTLWPPSMVKGSESGIKR